MGCLLAFDLSAALRILDGLLEGIDFETDLLEDAADLRVVERRKNEVVGRDVVVTLAEGN